MLTAPLFSMDRALRRSDSLFIAVWTWLRWPLAAFLLMLVVAIVYYAAPT